MSWKAKKAQDNQLKDNLTLANALTTLVQNRTAERTRLLMATEKTPQYLSSQQKAENDLVTLLTNLFPDKYKILLGRDEEGTINLWKIVADDAPGTKNEKIKIINELLVDFHMNVRNTRDPSKYWEPSTTNTWNRRLLAHLSENYGITLSIADFSFPGGFPGVLHTLFNERAATIKDYGTGKHKKILAEADGNIYEKAVTMLDKSDPKQMVMLILIINGLFFGLRGAEHATLEAKNLTHGSFESGHEFSQYKWIGLDHITDKSHKLSVHNNWVRDTNGSMRLPVIPEDPDSPGTIYWDYVNNRMSPGQTRLFCAPADNDMIMKFATKGYVNARYCHTKPLGKNKIAAYFRSGENT